MIIIALISPTANQEETILTKIPTLVVPDSSSETSPLQQMLFPKRGLSLQSWRPDQVTSRDFKSDSRSYTCS